MPPYPYESTQSTEFTEFTRVTEVTEVTSHLTILQSLDFATDSVYFKWDLALAPKVCGANEQFGELG